MADETPLSVILVFTHTLNVWCRFVATRSLSHSLATLAPSHMLIHSLTRAHSLPFGLSLSPSSLLSFFAHIDPHTLTIFVYIRVPSDLTEATRVSIHTQTELLSKRE